MDGLSQSRSRLDQYMKVRLTIQHDKANVKTVVLHSDAVIGRSTECNLRVASGQVSRKHCKLIVRSDRVAVVDLASSNGTLLDGEFLEANQETEVPSGGELEIGPVRFIVNYDASSADTQLRKDSEGSRPMQPAIPKKMVTLNDPSQGERVSWEEEDAIEPDSDSSTSNEKDLSSILEHMELEVDPNQKPKPGGHLEETHYEDQFDPDDTEGEEFKLEDQPKTDKPKKAPEDDENFMNFLENLEE